MSNSDMSDDYDSDDEYVSEDVIKSRFLSTCEKNVKHVLKLYTVESYRWLANAGEYAIMTAIHSPTRCPYTLENYMTRTEVDSFIRALYGRESNPFMYTLVDIISDLFFACNRIPKKNSCKIFLVKMCVNDKRLTMVKPNPPRAIIPLRVRTLTNLSSSSSDSTNDSSQSDSILGL